jgi:hypothetical protein
MKSILLLSLFLLFNLSVFAQEDLLSKVPELAVTAIKANGGALGCGAGKITLITGNGEIKLYTGLDPIHVFGSKVNVADLTKLLQARVKSNNGLEKNQMSEKNIGSLVYVILSVISESKDKTVVPVIIDLLKDGDEVIRAWAAISLFRLGESDEKIKKQLQKIVFPLNAVNGANGRSIKTPNWATLEVNQEEPR